MAQSPIDTVDSLIACINGMDLDAAMKYYTPDAIFVIQQGQIATGHAAIRTALEGFMSLKPTIQTLDRQVMHAGDTALYCGRWRLTGTSPDGKVEMGGVSSDVLRKQSNGDWLVSIDNPWGTSIVK